MGKKHRRHRSQDDNESNDDHEESPLSSSSPPKGKDLNMGFAEKRELQRHAAAEKRRQKQKCYLCGKSGHVRRQCPGIVDDGRGMSRYKGKSNIKTEVQKREQAREKRAELQQGGVKVTEAASVALHRNLEWPDGFEKKDSEEETSEDDYFVYLDAGCDVQATLDYLKSGRGKSKISQTEAFAEYGGVLEHARETSNLGARICRSLLKPNRPWLLPNWYTEDPIISEQLYFCIGLSRDFLVQEEDLLIEQAVNSLVDTYKAHPDLVVGFFAELDYTGTKLQTREAQLRRLQATCQAAGEAGLTLQIQVSPGAAGLDETISIKGTPYAQVLLDLQTQLIETKSTYPNLQIHLSCWSGRADHMISLLKAFPNNLFIGLDGSVGFAKTTQLHECAFDLELPKLVLESSTTIPAVVANALGRDAFFHSATIPYIAQAVAHYKKISAAAVGRAASINTLQLYPQLATSKKKKKKKKLANKMGWFLQRYLLWLERWRILQKEPVGRRGQACHVDHYASTVPTDGYLLVIRKEGEKGETVKSSED